MERTIHLRTLAVLLVVIAFTIPSAAFGQEDPCEKEYQEYEAALRAPGLASGMGALFTGLGGLLDSLEGRESSEQGSATQTAEQAEEVWSSATELLVEAAWGAYLECLGSHGLLCGEDSC